MDATSTIDHQHDTGPKRPPLTLATVAGWLANALLLIGVLGLVLTLAVATQLDAKAQERVSHGLEIATTVLAMLAGALGLPRRDRGGRMMTGACVFAGAVIVAAVLDGGLERMLSGRTSVVGTLFILAMVLIVGVFSRLVSNGAARAVLVAAWLDMSIYVSAIAIVLGVGWGLFANGGVVLDPAVLAGLVVVVAWCGAAFLLLLAREVRVSIGGPYAVLAGVGLVAIASLVILGSIGPSGLAPTMLAVDVVFGAGALLVGRGCLTWSMDADPGMGSSFLIRQLRDTVPTAAIMVSVILYILTEGLAQKNPVAFDVAQVAVVAGVALAGLRQILLKEYERRARAAEEASAAELAAHVDERRRVGKALAGLEAAETVEATAERICQRAIELPGVGFAILVRTEGDGAFVPIAAAGLDAPAPLGEALAADHVAHLMEHTGGGAWREPASPWLDRFTGGSGPGDVARIPLTVDGSLIGILTLGCHTQLSAEDGERRLLIVREAGVVATALLAPAMAAEEQLRKRRRRLEQVIADEAFYPVFQPIVDLATTEVKGYEALTRFADGSRPDLLFKEATAVGRGIELELATLQVAMRGCSTLPQGTYLSVNLSAELASRPELLGPLLTRVPRDLLLEITEHVQVGDYESLMASLYALDLRVRIAVDDAGSGYSGLSHILAVRPHVVKLDIALVRSVDLDLARQALVGAMVSFATRTGAQVVAEGIETAEEAATLLKLGAQLGQGYYFGRPERAPEPVDAIAAAAVAN